MGSKTKLRAVLLLAAIICLLLNGCADQVTRHKVLTTIFDGVPSLPSRGDMFEAYYQKRRKAELENRRAEGEEKTANQRSSHKPYDEKECSACHSSDKNVNAGLIVPKQELCGVCHEAFSGANLHGPVAVGDCLACHLPHSSKHPSLLIEDPDRICATCHQEKRLAAAMHDRFLANDISCGECHDPHAGDAHYFLK